MQKTIAGLLLAAFLALPASTSDARSRVPKRLAEMLATLESRLVNLDLEDAPLEKVLSRISTFTGVNLVVAPALREEAAERDLDVTLRVERVTARDALVIVLDLKGLAAVYRHGVIMVTTPEDARGKPKLEIYSIADLTFRIRDFPGPDLMLKPAGAEEFGIFVPEEEGKEHAFASPEDILDLVQENTGIDTWEDEGVRASVTDRLLVVRQYPGVHREIQRLLDLLRAYR